MSIIRKISNYELLCGKFGNVIVTSRIKGRITPTMLQQAFSILLQRHTLLRARVVVKEDNYYFFDTQITSVPLSITENCKSEDAKKEVLLRALNHQFNLKEIMIHVYVSIDCSIENINSDSIIEISTVISHIINDGLSHINLHKQLFELCNNQDSTHIPLDDPIILHPVEYYIEKTLEERGIKASDIVNPSRKTTTRKKQERVMPSVIPHKSVPNKKVYLTKNIVQRIIPHEFLKQLHQACKGKAVSLHSAYCAAQLKATYRQLATTEDLSMICMSSVDFRRNLIPPITDTYVFCSASGESTFHTLTQNTSFWSLAAEIGDKLKKYLKQYHFYKIPLKTLPYQPSEIFPSSLNINQITWDEVPIAVSVSDVGRIKMPTQFGNLKLQRINFCVNRYDGRIFTFITVLDDEMFINLMYQEALYNNLDMNTLLDNTLLELKLALNCSN